MTQTDRLVFATRPSALARWQTQWVIHALQLAWPGLACEEWVMSTQGDRILDRPLPEIGGKGLFTQELEAELLAGRVQVAVHSLKDLPVEQAGGVRVEAVPPRADWRDALVSARKLTLETLPKNARVGTSSLRRASQLLAYRPDLQIEPLRGNVDTRLRKALSQSYDAIILAGAGLVRLGLEQHITQWLPAEIMLPAPGQGALAVQCRADDRKTIALLQAINHPATHLAVTAERAFLAGLGGGCSLPVAAVAQIDAGEILLDGLVATPDGRRMIRMQMQGSDPQALGRRLAESVLAQGAHEILRLDHSA